MGTVAALAGNGLRVPSDVPSSVPFDLGKVKSLLSLFAATLAAQAGFAGKPFSVTIAAQDHLSDLDLRLTFQAPTHLTAPDLFASAFSLVVADTLSDAKPDTMLTAQAEELNLLRRHFLSDPEREVLQVLGAHRLKAKAIANRLPEDGWTQLALVLANMVKRGILDVNPDGYGVTHDLFRVLAQDSSGS